MGSILCQDSDLAEKVIMKAMGNLSQLIIIFVTNASSL